MQIQTHQRRENLVLFTALFAANITVLLGAFWLTPQFVFFSFVIWLLLAFTCVLIVYQQRITANFFTLFLENWHILPFLIFSALSISWSVVWQVSLARWFTLVATLIVGAYLGFRYRPGDMFRLVTIFVGGLLLVNVLYIILAPGAGIMNYYIIQGAWRGIFWHKNHLGFMVAFGNILFLVNMILAFGLRKKITFAWGLLYLFSLFVLYKTDSVGAWLTLVIVHGVILIGLAYIKFGYALRRGHYLVIGFVLLVAFVVILLNLGTIFGFFNRGTSLTGRIPMWDYVFTTYLSQRPFTGYGFNAFWYVDPYRVDIGIAARYPDPIVIADNGFIDILINTGAIGLFLFLIFYGNAAWKSIVLATRARDILDFFPLILLVFISVSNITWTLLFENENFLFLILVMVLFSLTSHTSSATRTTYSAPR